MLTIVGTVPEKGLPLLIGPARLQGHHLVVAGRHFPVNRGTPALLAASLATAEVLGLSPPVAYLAGDIGLGDGSRHLYAHLAANISQENHDVMVFHYLQPDIDWHGRVLLALRQMIRAPILVADAGYMYVAKMSGQAEEYDLFTPDVGELSFLADDKAPHPFYTRGFILHMESRIEEMISMAYRHRNAAKWLLVKGKTDYIADCEGVRFRIGAPSIPTLEPIGGTGDTVTGIAAALLDAAMPVPEAAKTAALINRVAGRMAVPTPATQVTAVIDRIGDAVAEVMNI
jgi:NAD(P)H-hydrate repair Nnr-like enzyme with NAD(P)H-hydrate dehydratase domain